MVPPATPVVSPKLKVSTSVSPQIRVTYVAAAVAANGSQPVPKTTQFAVIVPRRSIVVP